MVFEFSSEENAPPSEGVDETDEADCRVAGAEGATVDDLIGDDGCAVEAFPVVALVAEDSGVIEDAAENENNNGCTL